MTGESAPASGSRGFAAFRQRDFRWLIFGKVCSWTGLHMMMVAIAYQVYDLTGDVMNLAYIGLSIFAPAMGLALFTGYVADRFDRRRVLAICFVVMLGSALLFLIITLSGMPDVWPVFAVLVLLGAGRAFYMPAANSLVPNLVPIADLPNALAWNTSIHKIGQVVGPALGGMLYLAGPEIVYATASAGFVVAIIATSMIRTRVERAGREPISLGTLLAGLRYVYSKNVLFGAITLDLFVVLLGGVTALFPVFAKDILEVGASGAGFLRSAMAAGAVLSGLALTQIALDRAVGRILFFTIFIYGAATLAFGLSEIYWLSLLAMGVIGASDMVSVYIRVTLLQIATPDEMRGRVNAVNSVFTGASNEIGEFRAGAMAALIGVVPAVLVGGIGAIVVTAAGWKLFPDLVRIERMDREL
ncbi:MAG: MFS transporter [Alphaproteobacteria bacterium]